MADVIRKATNKFTKGLVMDFSPENTKNELLTHALNATLLTFNGNELSLQNDMGNARVETAFLPEGYMPVGTCEYGGIIYIVSYNPLEDKSQIGCFPSPERNISSDELGKSSQSIMREKFQQMVNDVNGAKVPNGKIVNTTQYVILKDSNLNPGDKFLVCAENDLLNENLKDLYVKKDGSSEFTEVNNPILAIHVVSIEDSGKVVYLNDSLRCYDTVTTYVENDATKTATYRYHISGKMIPSTSQLAQTDIDAYRDTLSSGYNVFKSKTSGKLALLVELITIDSYSVTHEVRPVKDSLGNTVEGCFDVVIHTDVTPEVTIDNYNNVPKLQYYFLENSQGYLQTISNAPEASIITKPLFIEGTGDDVGVFNYNSNFFDTKLSEIYSITAGESSELVKTLEQTGNFNFPKANTYHGRMLKVNSNDVLNGTATKHTYTKFTEGKYYRVRKSQIADTFINYFTKDLRAKLYRFDTSNTNYVEVPGSWETLNSSYSYYVKIQTPHYYNAQRNVEAFKDKDIPLYELKTIPKFADDDILENALIEKYEKRPSEGYFIATEEDFLSGERLYELIDGYYSPYAGDVVEGNTYYIKKQLDFFESIGFTNINRDDHLDIYYYPSEKEYIEVDGGTLEEYWDETKYPIIKEEPYYGYDKILYYRKMEDDYRLATSEELIHWQKDSTIEFYYKPDYVYIHPDEFSGVDDSTYQLFITVPFDAYVSESKFTPNTTDNYLEGCTRPAIRFDKPSEYPYDDALSMYVVADFIPNNLNSEEFYEPYGDLKLGNIKIPDLVTVSGSDLPFRYNYTIVPCMNYGRLDHLRVSNTVDFSKLQAFNQSDFVSWKYHIDNDHLRLTFSTEIFDTYEDCKVDGLILEFYDCWGFAGSLEISGKKSYSGEFTKVIPLNTLNALSNKRVVGTDLVDTFTRNINISENADGTYSYNGDPVEFRGWSSGWKYSDSSKPFEDNDCGTLYSNLVYGVRTYLKRSQATQAKEKFVTTKEFFVYTYPLYNDYYYSVSDFSTLHNPSVDFALTYKLQDSGSISAYNDTGYVNGYNSTDKAKVDKYLSGNYDSESLNVTKYYNYFGTTHLYLEVGLPKEYESFNIKCHSDLNNLFRGTIQIVGESDENVPYTVKYDTTKCTSASEALNYDDTTLLNKNTIKFKDQNSSIQPINYGLSTHAFLSNAKATPIDIAYNFIIGFKTTVSNIKESRIPATTVCALCHDIGDGNYNYEDFGVYISDGGEYLSSALMYNGGTTLEEEFGLCRQIDLGTGGGGVGDEECSAYQTVKTPAKTITTPGKLNTGEPLKQITPFIGKLTFCQPHAHSISPENGVNVNVGTLGISPDENIKIDKKNTEQTQGSAPTDELFQAPRYNLVLNTKNMINYNSEFISTIGYEIVNGPVRIYRNTSVDSSAKYDMRKFTGFSWGEVTEFNKRMVQTMKNVYAYNPDYDTLPVNLGDISVVNNSVSFVGNLISKNASFTFPNSKSLNDYIYFGNMAISTYLRNMSTYSEDFDGVSISVYESESEFLPQVQFVPNLTYCGTNTTPYLLTEVNYKINEPSNLQKELTYSVEDSITIQHSDGTKSNINGAIDKKALYGFDSNLNKLIQLDVSNYTIDSNGTLTLKSEYSAGSGKGTLYLKGEQLYSMYNNEYAFNHFVKDQSITTTVQLGVDLNIMYMDVLSVKGNSIIAVQYNGANSQMNYGFRGNIWTATENNKGYTHKPVIDSFGYKVAGNLLDMNKVGLQSYGSKLDLRKQSHEALQALASHSHQSFTRDNGRIDYNSNYWYLDDNNFYLQDITIDPRYPTFMFDWAQDHTIAIIEFKIKSLNFTVNRTSSLANNNSSVVQVLKTKDYFDIEQPSYKNTKVGYIVKDAYKDSCISGTSLTINDLQYEPELNGHRLFVVRNPKWSATFGKYRSSLFYRSMTPSTEWYDSYNGIDYINYNRLYLYTGPCFTSI